MFFLLLWNRILESVYSIRLLLKQYTTYLYVYRVSTWYLCNFLVPLEQYVKFFIRKWKPGTAWKQVIAHLSHISHNDGNRNGKLKNWKAKDWEKTQRETGPHTIKSCGMRRTRDALVRCRQAQQQQQQKRQQQQY